jgi:hypothetical protein
MGTITFRDKQFKTDKLSATAEGYNEEVNVINIDDTISDKAISKCIAIKVSGTYHLLTGAKSSNPTQTLRVITKHVLAKSEVLPDNYLSRLNLMPENRNYSHQFKQHNDGRLRSTFTQRRTDSRM